MQAVRNGLIEKLVLLACAMALGWAASGCL